MGAGTPALAVAEIVDDPHSRCERDAAALSTRLDAKGSSAYIKKARP
jgi:hypothetical protein